MSEQKVHSFFDFKTSGLSINRWFLVFLFICHYTCVSTGTGMKGGVCMMDSEEAAGKNKLIIKPDQVNIWDYMRREGIPEESTNVFAPNPEEEHYRQMIRQHKAWLESFPHECPSPFAHYRIGVYIRFFNQTKYENYLDYHKQQFADTIALCPNWTLVDYYVDEGSTAPNMENCPGWTRLLEDCFHGCVDLIVTQKISNVSRKVHELTFCSRILAALKKPVGIYFISEDLFTLATYYQGDLHDWDFLPSEDWEMLPAEDSEEYWSVKDEDPDDP